MIRYQLGGAELTIAEFGMLVYVTTPSDDLVLNQGGTSIDLTCERGASLLCNGGLL